MPAVNHWGWQVRARPPAGYGFELGNFGGDEWGGKGAIQGTVGCGLSNYVVYYCIFLGRGQIHTNGLGRGRGKRGGKKRMRRWRKGREIERKNTHN